MNDHRDSVWAHRYPSHPYWLAPRGVWLISGERLGAGDGSQ